MHYLHLSFFIHGFGLVMEEVLVGLIGAGAPELDGKVFPLAAAQDALLPYAVYVQTNSVPTATSHSSAATVTVTVQIYVYAKTFTEAKASAERVIAAVDGYRTADKGLFFMLTDQKPAYDQDGVFEHMLQFNVKIS